VVLPRSEAGGGEHRGVCGVLERREDRVLN
jgi:hypothetical protein